MAAFPCLAADIVLQAATDVLPAVITISGQILPGDDQVFIRKALTVEAALVVLSSEGGSLQAGLGIGKAIRMRNFGTVATVSNECTSVCALAWLGGPLRYMEKGARLGFHAAYEIAPDGQAKERGVGNALVGAYLTQLGYSDFQIAKFTESPPEAFNWFTAEDFIALGIGVQTIDPSVTPRTAEPNLHLPKFAPKSRELFAVKGWTKTKISTGDSGASYPAFAMRLVNTDRKSLLGHLFVACPPATIGPYIEFSVGSDDLAFSQFQESAVSFSIDGEPLTASASGGSIFIMMDSENLAPLERASARILSPGSQTLVIDTELLGTIDLTLYDWTPDYARRYSNASGGDRLLPAKAFTKACNDVELRGSG